ncbi:arp2/3 complex-activating protein rickA-like [Helianthus annuus]|uniref:arp2/3 complex-activating protein rickA-like n=1 Tax=Helianthus annuus TaxID=4232 RepID=UPI001653057A|nr:arp2/3 complex-activating protein rickA-like [Helianthus annuus]
MVNNLKNVDKEVNTEAVEIEVVKEIKNEEVEKAVTEEQQIGEDVKKEEEEVKNKNLVAADAGDEVCVEEKQDDAEMKQIEAAENTEVPITEMLFKTAIPTTESKGKYEDELNARGSVDSKNQETILKELVYVKPAENVFSTGVRGGTSVVPPIFQGHQYMSTEQLHKELEDTTAVCTEKTATEGKLDLIVKEIRNQKSDIKVLSETVKAVQKQTEDNAAALNKLQESSENRESSSEFKKALKELQEINKQMAEVASAGESSSTGRILEEIQFLRANNSSMAEAFEKLMVELSTQKDQNKLELQKMKKQEESNIQDLADVHLLVKRLQYNVARLAKVDFHELKAPIPQENPAGESETPQQKFKQPEITQQDPTKQSETSTPQKQKIPMGPPPSKPKLLMGPPPNIPKPDTSTVQ